MGGILGGYRFGDHLHVYVFRKSRDFSIYNLIVLIVIKIETSQDKSKL